MSPVLRDEAAIRAGLHAVVELGGYRRVVRGIAEFTHLATRDPAVEVWVDGPHGGDLHTVTVLLERLRIYPGRAS